MVKALAVASSSPGRMNFMRIMPSSSRPNYLLNLKLKPTGAALCAPAPLSQEVDVGIICEPCNGRGWLLCDFCQGQKTNVKAQNNRIYRRCPSCRAVGYVLCSKCKVFKCVTFPNYDDGQDLVL
ncbi:hypothetical protein Patl1_12737 [Pistacia atlantica]|uniref:Uncharacterized protein n=1 Tax=Pistacia atlantica TaxID=434234 RepID=A0ACC1AY59_9ROSI|nr:hypothetical protein Patl1_12737 [Pistacia atlantica]